MSIDRKTERAAKFHRKRNAKNKQKEKKYIKEKNQLGLNIQAKSLAPLPEQVTILK